MTESVRSFASRGGSTGREPPLADLTHRATDALMARGGELVSWVREKGEDGPVTMRDAAFIFGRSAETPVSRWHNNFSPGRRGSGTSGQPGRFRLLMHGGQSERQAIG